MPGMGNSRSDDSGSGVIHGPNSIAVGVGNDKLSGYAGVGVSDGEIDSVQVGGLVGKYGGGLSYDGDEVAGFFDIGAISGSYDSRTGAMEGATGTLALTGRVGYDGQGTGYVAGDVLSHELVRLNLSENPDFVPDAEHQDLLQEYLLAQTEEMRDKVDGAEPYNREKGSDSPQLIDEASDGGSPSDFPEQGSRYEGELEWFGGFPTLEEALSDPVPASALAPSSVGVPESVLPRVDELVEEHGYTGAQARDEVRQEMLRTSPAENYGDSDALDGDGTDWSADEAGEPDPTTPRDNWGRNTDALDGAGTDWGSNEAGDPGSANPRDAWGYDNGALNGDGTDWSPDGENDGYSTSPVDNWGEDNEALDGSGTEWSAEEGDEPTEEDGGHRDSGSQPGAAAAGFGALGRALATESGVDGATETAALSTVAGTLGQNLGQEVGEGTGFEDFGSDLSDNAGSTATGLVAGEVTADLAESLGFDGTGFGDQLGARMTQHAVSSTIDAGVNAATSSDTLGQSLGESFSPGTFGTVAGGFVGGYLGGEFLEEVDFSADTQTGATVGAIGGAVGTAVGTTVGTSAGTAAGAEIGGTIGTNIMPVVGTVIGAFVGAVFGTVFGSEFGDLFGSEPPPPPEAEATLSYSVADGFQVTDADDAHGGNAGGMATAAQRAGEVLNTLVEATGGRLKDPASVEDLTIGYSGEHMTVNGRDISGPEGVEVLIEEALAGQAIEGGDAYIKRALYRQIEAGETAPADLVEALSAGGRYSAAREDQERLERLREDPEIAAELAALADGEIGADELSDEALAVHRAKEALAEGEARGLDEAHRFDTASRLNDRFAGQGIDLEGVALEDLVVHQQEGRLVVGIRDPEDPDAAVGALPHATVEAYTGDFDAARLYLDGREHDLAAVLERVGADATTGPVHIGTALADRYAGEDAAVHTGSSGRDTLAGGDGADILLGGAGGDALDGGGGDDRLLGGAGADTLDGGEGEDTADYRDSDGSVAVDLGKGRGAGGHASGDRLHDFEHLAGSSHADELRGDDTANTLAGRGGNDRLMGAGGDDTLDGGTGDDIISGGSGDDRISGGTGDDIAAGGVGDDFVMGGAGDDRLDGGADDDILAGGGGNDILAGGAGRDHLEGGAGNDILMGRADGDRLEGGAGEDTVVYSGSWEDYRVDLVDGELQVSAVEGGAPADRLTDIESIAFDEQSFRVENLREILEAQNEADEDERNRRLTGTPAAGPTSLGDAAALGVIGWIVADMAAGDDGSVDGAYTMDPSTDGARMVPVFGGESAPSDPTAITVGPDGETTRAATPGEVNRFFVADGDGGNGSGGGNVEGHAGVPENPASFVPVIAPSALADADRADDAGDDATADDPQDNEEASGAVEGSTDEDADGDGIDHEESIVLYGTVGDDELIDYGGRGAVVGLAGDDFIAGLDGDDTLLGGPGDDVILPGRGDDAVDGGEGIDTVSYRDVDEGVTVDLDAGAGLAGPASDDELDSIEHAEGSAYTDRLIADPRGSRLFGLAGDDVLLGDTSDDTLAGGADTDRLEGMEGNDTLYGDAGHDELIGGVGDDRLSGGRGDDRLNGGVGDDTLRGGAGADRLEGVEGGDTLDGGSGDDLVLGGTGDDRLAGGEDDDRLEGAEGDDRLFGDAGDDRLLGGAKEDRLRGGTGDDNLTGGSGADELSGDDGDDVLEGDEGMDTLYGGAGNDRLHGGEGADALHGDSGDDVLHGGDGDDRILDGGAGDDRLYGDSGDDDLLGGRGDDILKGGAGADTFNGQSGDDLLRVDADDDPGFVDGGAGRDTVELTETRPGAVDLDALSSVEIARGSSVDDTFDGTFALDRIEGGGGDDRVLFDNVSVFDVDAFDWSDDRDELTIRRGGEHVTVAAETVGFAEGDVGLGGVDNAPFIADGSLEGLRTDEDVPLRFTREDLDIEVLDVDTGESSGSEGITAIGGIDIELGRALGDAYHSEYPGLGRELDTATGDVTSYSIESRPRGGSYVRFESQFDGTGGDDELIGSEAFPHAINSEPRSGQTWVTFPGPKGGNSYQAENTGAADGNDVLRGFGGDDILVGGASSDVLRGGGGNDTADYSRSGAGVNVDLLSGDGAGGTATGDTLFSIENLIGSDHGDDLAGNSDDNVLEGRIGNDRVIGGAGDDRLYGGKGSDVVEGGRGDDRIHGGAGNDVLSGGAGDDVIIGGRGSRDVAAFSGIRDEYSLAATSDHLVVEHAETGDRDRVYGVQELRFDDRSVYIDEVDARNGTLRVTDNDFVFDPDPDFNSLEGAMGGFTVSVGEGGVRTSTMAEVEVDEVNDPPEMLPGAVNYESIGALDYGGTVRDGLFVRSEIINTERDITRFEWHPLDPDHLSQARKTEIADAMGSGVDVDDLEAGHEYGYQTVNRTGRINARDPDGPNGDLRFELVEDASPGYVDLESDGSFRYRLNTGAEAPDDPAVTGSVVTQEAVPQQGRRPAQPEESTLYALHDLENTPEGDPTTRGQHASFTVRVTDSGEGGSDPESIEYEANIVSKHPPEDDDCLPVALDLGDDGLDFQSIDDSDLLADINADGDAEQLAWVSGDDALLMLDRDGDGQFSDPDEISFADDHRDARTDMEGLALAFDTNDNGRLDTGDQHWEDFHVWQDADEDGKSDPGELRTLDQEGIESIGVVSDGREENAADGDVTIFGRSVFTRSDGSAGTAGDVAFATAPSDAGGDTEQVHGTATAASDEWVAMLAQRMAQAGAGRTGGDDAEVPPVDDATLAAAMSGSDAFEMATESG